MANFIPINDRVLIQRMQPKENKGLIVIPEEAKEIPLEAKVIAVGPAITADITVGSIVLFGQYAGTPVTIDGEDMIILREDEIFGFFKE